MAVVVVVFGMLVAIGVVGICAAIGLFCSVLFGFPIWYGAAIPVVAVTGRYAVLRWCSEPT